MRLLWSWPSTEGLRCRGRARAWPRQADRTRRDRGRAVGIRANRSLARRCSTPSVLDAISEGVMHKCRIDLEARTGRQVSGRDCGGPHSRKTPSGPGITRSGRPIPLPHTKQSTKTQALHRTADGASAILSPSRCAKRRRSGTCDKPDQPRPRDISRTYAPPSALMGPEGTLPRHTAHGGRPGSPRVEVGCWGRSRNRANPRARPLPAAESLAVPEEGAAAVDGPSLGRPSWTLDRFRPCRRSVTRRSLSRRAATREALTGCRVWACGSRPGAR